MLMQTLRRMGTAIALLGFTVLLILVTWAHYYQRTLPWTSTLTQMQVITDVANIELPVTRILHQSWKTSILPPRFKQLSASWHECFPNWEYRLWNNSDNRQFLFQHYPWFLNTYDTLPADINRADSVRYFYLFHFGGLYTDLDNECLKPFEPLLANYTFVFGAMAGQYASYIPEGYVQNSFMYSRPREPFWMELIYNLMTNVSSRRVPESQTGPILLVKTINQFRARNPNTHKEILKIYPPEYFNPYNWLRLNDYPPVCKVHNQMNADELRLCREFFVRKGSYVVQYHSQTWSRGPVI